MACFALFAWLFCQILIGIFPLQQELQQPVMIVVKQTILASSDIKMNTTEIKNVKADRHQFSKC